MKKLIAFTILLITVNFVGGFAQNNLNGTISDAVSKEKVPFSSIYCINTGTGTISNENGDFSLTVASFPVKLIISNVIYLKDTVEIKTGNDVKIFLKPNVKELKEVVVSNLGYKLINQAIDKIAISQKNVTYGKGFYRQLTYNGDKITQFQEAFYNLKQSSSKIEGIKITNARFAKLPTDSVKKYFSFVNFSYLILGQKAMSESKKVDVNSILSPLRKDVSDNYTVSVQEFIGDIEKEKIAVLYCKPNTKSNIPAFEGEIYIKMYNSEIVKIEGKIHHGLGAEIENDKVKTSNFIYSFDITMKDGLMNLIKGELTCDEFIKFRNEKRAIKILATFLVYESNIAKEGKYREVKLNVDDLRDIQKTNYNPAFWRNNPIIKRTDLEDSIIKLFEQKGTLTNMSSEDLD
jgi:hypothetical protein